MKDEPQQIAPYSVRMEPELRKALEDSARGNSRSLHAEIILRLTQSLDQRQKGEAQITEDRVREIVKDELEKSNIRDEL